MRSITLFKGSAGKHTALTIYGNQHEENIRKKYLILEFWFTSKSQTSGGKTVGDFTNKKIVRYGMEMGSGIGEIGSLLRFFRQDKTVFDKDKNTVSLLHKTPTAEKALVLGKFDNGVTYMSVEDRKEKITVSLSFSPSEMVVLDEYIKAALQMFRYEDVSNQSGNTKVDQNGADNTGNTDDVPF